MKNKVIIMGILALLFGCKDKTQDHTASMDNKTVRVEQEEGFTEIETGEKDTRTYHLEQDSVLFLPVIRNFEKNDVFYKTICHKKLGGNIGAFIARVEVQPNGRTGIDYVLESNLIQYKISGDDAWNISLRNLKNAKLTINGMKDKETGDDMIHVSSKIGLATSILCDFEFIDQFKTDLKTEKLHVTIINSGTVYFTAPNSSFEKSFENIALEGAYTDVINIHSATYLWDNHTLKLLKMYKE